MTVLSHVPTQRSTSTAWMWTGAFTKTPQFIHDSGHSLQAYLPHFSRKLASPVRAPRAQSLSAAAGHASGSNLAKKCARTSGAYVSR
jgi:hypothetical protein